MQRADVYIDPPLTSWVAYRVQVVFPHLSLDFPIGAGVGFRSREVVIPRTSVEYLRLSSPPRLSFGLFLHLRHPHPHCGCPPLRLSRKTSRKPRPEVIFPEQGPVPIRSPLPARDGPGILSLPLPLRTLPTKVHVVVYVSWTPRSHLHVLTDSSGPQTSVLTVVCEFDLTLFHYFRSPRLAFVSGRG